MNIPDSVSRSTLAALLAANGQLPVSPAIPTLRFGSEDGAPCDLQLALLALIQQSTSGVNLCQLVTSALFLLYNAQTELNRWHYLAAHGEPPFDHDCPQEREAAALAMADLSAVINAVAPLIEDLNRALIAPLVVQRIEDCGKPADQEQQGDYYSRLLVSDAILEDLSLTRDDVTRFLSAHL